MLPVGTLARRKLPTESIADATWVPATLTLVAGLPAATTVPVIVAAPVPEGEAGEPPLQATVAMVAANNVARWMRVMPRRKQTSHL